MSFAQTLWQTLSKLDVGKHIEKKGQLSYLSWTWAWAAFMDAYPESTYEVSAPVVHGDGSVMCHITVTAREGEESLSREMWLPVMDHRNKAIQNPSATEINKTQMRCLVKCLAMFGLGHYIYAGEDLPEPQTISEQQVEQLMQAINVAGSKVENVCGFYKVQNLGQLTQPSFEHAMEGLKRKAQAQEKAA